MKLNFCVQGRAFDGFINWLYLHCLSCILCSTFLFSFMWGQDWWFYVCEYCFQKTPHAHHTHTPTLRCASRQGRCCQPLPPHCRDSNHVTTRILCTHTTHFIHSCKGLHRLLSHSLPFTSEETKAQRHGWLWLPWLILPCWACCRCFPRLTWMMTTSTTCLYLVCVRLCSQCLAQTSEVHPVYSLDAQASEGKNEAREGLENRPGSRS